MRGGGYNSVYDETDAGIDDVDQWAAGGFVADERVEEYYGLGDGGGGEQV